MGECPTYGLYSFINRAYQEIYGEQIARVYVFPHMFQFERGKRYPGTAVIISQICVITVSLKIIMI